MAERERELRDVLDESLTLLIEGQVTLEGCLTRYPDHAAELRPLLEMALTVRRVAPPEPRPQAVIVGRERMMRAVGARERRRASAAPQGLRARALLNDLRAALTQRPAWAVGWAAAAALLLLVLVGGLFLRPWTGPTVGQLVTVDVRQGLVEVLPAGAGAWRVAASGQDMEPGTRLRTGPDAAALLTFYDGSMTVMGGGTEIVLERLRAPREGFGRVVVLRQERGRTEHRVEAGTAPGARFEVHSPLAVVAVRGTEFAVTVQDDGTTEVAVGQEGLVEVLAMNETIQLLPGWATTVEPQQPPATPFAAPAPLEYAFPPRPDDGLAETATASATPAPSDTPVPTLLPPTRTPWPTATPVPQGAFPTPTDTRVPLATPTAKATATPTLTPTATATESLDDDDVHTPPGPSPSATPSPTPTEKVGPTAEPTEQATEVGPGPSPTPTEERPGGDDGPAPGPGG